MTVRISTVLVPFGPATALELTDAQVDALGGGKRAAVVVGIAGRTARVRLAVMDGRNVIGLSKAVRAELGVDIGDAVEATVDLDTAERAVDVPADLAAALDAEPPARRAFEALSYSRRKELARGVAEAKRPETRERRIAAAVETLRA
ncbi:YdeI/OmpD-associated family protein [Agromyces sp. H3Y2-19a]|uniref:YdeI/OmpD-associated family protein n=1 Tax=Agromyces TaxID=33877 RepID=UPI001E61E114|nr:MULTISPECIES: YdeI/OmpD-associated family protein [Agromyces]MCD5347096.1 YdeI/OmpD-associated family protein [Agromyces sp. S2-1-8]MDF0515285.1 YdeI/OmpD-associated family protein [Agromyces chromiiresistens]